MVFYSEESISEVTNIVSADFVHGTFYATPQLLQQTGYRNPEDPLNTAMQLAFNAPGKAPYEIFVSKPESAKAIGMILNAMGIPPSQQVQYTYPLQQELVDGFDKSESDAFLVDIGAGNAHVVSALRKAMPHIPGRLVAQDLAPVIARAPALAEPDEKQAHDFFTEQPLKREYTTLLVPNFYVPSHTIYIYPPPTLTLYFLLPSNHLF